MVQRAFEGYDWHRSGTSVTAKAEPLPIEDVVSTPTRAAQEPTLVISTMTVTVQTMSTIHAGSALATDSPTAEAERFDVIVRDV